MSAEHPWLPEGNAMLEQGLANRRRVLGEDYVERSLSAADGDPLKQKLQECVTGLAWGGVWGRPGLDPKSRSLITLSVLLAHGDMEEFALHLRGALHNGWTPDELAEAIIHIGCYAGWPAAVKGFRAAAEILSQARMPAEPAEERG